MARDTSDKGYREAAAKVALGRGDYYDLEMVKKMASMQCGVIPQICKQALEEYSKNKR